MSGEVISNDVIDINENLREVIKPQRRLSVELYFLIVEVGDEIYAKIGDTTRGAHRRHDEWKKKDGFEDSVLVEFWNISEGYDDRTPRDYTFHQALKEAGYHNITKDELPAKVYFSNELFNDDSFHTEDEEGIKKKVIDNIEYIIEDIRKDYEESGQHYKLYSLRELDDADDDWDGARTEITLRPSQKEMVDRFTEAIGNGEDYLLCAAPPRFGKSIATMSCANTLPGKDNKLVIIASAKVDVKDEWKKTIERFSNFEKWKFLDRNDLHNKSAIEEALEHGNVAVFISLADFQGKGIKKIHEEILKYQWDLLVVDEVHYGADGEAFGEKIKSGPMGTEKKDKHSEKDDKKSKNALNNLLSGKDGGHNQLKYSCRLDLSGTPYDILMAGRFSSGQIVYQACYEDIIAARDEWYENHMEEDEAKNPYYDFPDLVSFGWALSNADTELIREFTKDGDLDFSKLFATKKKTTENGTEHVFVNEKEVVAFLKAFDGTANDNGYLSIIGSDAFKKSMETVHAVMVLPSCPACDAMKNLLAKKKQEFDTLCEYTPYQLTGDLAKGLPKDAAEAKRWVRDKEKDGISTISLTVDRFLTGVSIPEWNVMIYAKNCASAQSYEQAKCRILTPYSVKTEGDGKEAYKLIKKQQGIFIDCYPDRIFKMEESKALAEVQATIDTITTEDVREKMRKNLSYATIVLIDNMNGHFFKKMKLTDIQNAITNYNEHRSIEDQMKKIAFNEDLLDDESIMEALKRVAIETKKSKSVIAIPAFEKGDGSDIEDIERLKEALEQGQTKTETMPPEKDDMQEKDDLADSEDNKDNDNMLKLREMMRRIVIASFMVTEECSGIQDLVELALEKGNDEDGVLSKLYKFGISGDFLVSACLNMDTNTRYYFDQILHNFNTLRRDPEISCYEKVRIFSKKIKNFGVNEFITPSAYDESQKDNCNANAKNAEAPVPVMVEMIKPQIIAAAENQNDKILCLSEEVGEFSLAIAEYMREDLKCTEEQVKNTICATYDGDIASVVVPEVFKMAELDPENILPLGSSEICDIIKQGEESSCKGFADALRACNNGKLCEALNEEQGEEEKKMTINFKAVVGNPPYQQPKIGETNTMESIYNEFVDMSMALSDNAVLVIPGRWLFNAGRAPAAWKKKMLNNEHIRVLYYNESMSEVFQGVDLKGGVCIIEYNENESYDPIILFNKHEEMRSVLSKVKTHIKNNGSMRGIAVSNCAYHFSESMHQDNPVVKNDGLMSKNNEYNMQTNVLETLDGIVFFEKKPADDGTYVRMMGRVGGSRTERWVKREYLVVPDNFARYKVGFPKATGTGTFGEKLARPFIMEPLVGHTQTYLTFGDFEDDTETKNCCTYLMTKFARAMLGTLKVTPDNLLNKWSNVPLQDFTENSDIDWSKSIAEIDQQLYEKYGLAEEEIAFIEANVKEMK